MRGEQLLDRFSRCQLLKNELHGNAGPSNDRFAHHDRRICLDQFFSHGLFPYVSTATPNTPAWITQTPASLLGVSLQVERQKSPTIPYVPEEHRKLTPALPYFVRGVQGVLHLDHPLSHDRMFHGHDELR